MVAQYSILDLKEYEKKSPKKKRVRYGTPTYKKVYKLLTNESGFIQDEKHIFRYSVLHKIYSIIPNYINFNVFNQCDTLDKINLILFHYDKDFGNSAEILGTAKLSLKERLLIHIRLLKLLKQGFDIQTACKKSIKYWYKLK